jgi:hypothetical protein
VPVVLLRALGEQLPRVEAVASLRRAAEVALGSGSLKRQDALDLRGRWLRQADARPRRKVRTVSDLKAAAASLGITVEEVKTNG